MNKFDIVLSTKPKYVNMIENRTKRFEFRKTGFTKHINRVYLYESSPIQKITCYFKISRIIKNDPNLVWSATCQYAGMNSKDFDHYYSLGRKTAYAIGIKSFHRLSRPLLLSDLGIKHAPESFVYVNGEKHIQEPKNSKKPEDKPFKKMRKSNNPCQLALF